MEEPVEVDISVGQLVDFLKAIQWLVVVAVRGT
jgi:hypothetical protein